MFSRGRNIVDAADAEGERARGTRGFRVIPRLLEQDISSLHSNLTLPLKWK